jgi:hypothetical protein
VEKGEHAAEGDNLEQPSAPLVVIGPVLPGLLTGEERLVLLREAFFERSVAAARHLKSRSMSLFAATLIALLFLLLITSSVSHFLVLGSYTTGSNHYAGRNSFCIQSDARQKDLG